MKNKPKKYSCGECSKKYYFLRNAIKHRDKKEHHTKFKYLVV